MHPIAGEFSLIRNLTQEWHNYKGTSLNGGDARTSAAQSKDQPKENQSNKQTGKSATSCMD